MSKAKNKQQQLETWLLEQLSCVMGIGHDDLRAMLPYMMSLPTEREAREHMNGLLGPGAEARALVNEFVQRRFASGGGRETKASTHADAAAGKSAKREQSGKAGKKNASNASSKKEKSMEKLAREFGSGGSLYRKSSNEETYFAASGSSTPRGKSPKVPGKTARAETPTATGQGTPVLMNTMPQQLSDDATDSASSSTGRRKKGDANAAAPQQGKKEKQAKQRPACYCLARKHGLFTNCLKCGKIICNAEGPGACTFCGNDVQSPQQQLEALARERRERRQAQQQQQRRKAPVKPDQSAQARSYKAKVTGGFASGWNDPALHEPSSDDIQKEEEAQQKADARKERLLEFDRTSAQRTRVIDQASDFALPYEADDKWLDPEERARIAAERQQRLEELEERERRGGKARVITIDLAGKCVVEARPESKPRLAGSSGVVAPAGNALQKSLLASARSSAGKAGSPTPATSHSLKNPLLTKKMRPVYVAEDPATEEEKAGGKRREGRAQIGVTAGTSATTIDMPSRGQDFAETSDDAAARLKNNALKMRTRHKIGRVQHESFLEMFE
ncbi:hypothetical protein THASP1DRAFT_27728 [Thamnocephalis sphaerospora]|uniref:Uncharacterized protein n=1 Tax=Thamnocephalis sphaerospora TaxID=78915 RepID=A0A4P9XYI5_9FUNG|nr:hypothetical protein THASP1DRAFT_27728 [Thamnocephalis sphaerospora]|eukprot:RKP10490.1 hypothetical protein THASP1DRAFT_27728 [Thamnocephalis sphaerospora]